MRESPGAFETLKKERKTERKKMKEIEVKRAGVKEEKERLWRKTEKRRDRENRYKML